jgi:hypothetical protein
VETGLFTSSPRGAAPVVGLAEVQVARGDVLCVVQVVDQLMGLDRVMTVADLLERSVDGVLPRSGGSTGRRSVDYFAWPGSGVSRLLSEAVVVRADGVRHRAATC